MTHCSRAAHDRGVGGDHKSELSVDAYDEAGEAEGLAFALLPLLFLGGGTVWLATRWRARPGSAAVVSGFETAAPLAEEAKDPKRTIRRAVVGATLSIGALYVFTTYAVDVACGPGRFAGFMTSGQDSWQGLARSPYGLFWVLVFLARCPVLPRRRSSAPWIPS